MKDFSGELYLDTLFPNLKNSEIVDSSVKKSKEKIHTKEEKIRIYLDRLNRIHKKAKVTKNDEYLLNQYYKKYVISFEDAEKELYKNKNPLNDLTSNQVVDAQIRSLTKWINFLSDDEFSYPLWCKYLIFQSIVKIGNFIEDKDTYAKRSIKKTLSPFFPINEEAVYKAIKEIRKQVEEAGLSKEKIKKIIDDGSFTDKYLYYYKKYQNNKLDHSKKEDGIWKKYHEGNEKEAIQLYKDIKDKGTGWCTASDENLAISQVCGGEMYEGGDFYVYFTKDEYGNYTIPRIAIRMDGTDIVGEIRGVAESQNMEDGLEDIILDKLGEIDIDDELDFIMLKIDNCKKLTKINKKVSNNEELSLEDILFIYEVTSEIYTFGYSKDPRIEKIKKQRDAIKDYKRLTSYSDKRRFLNINSNLIPDKCITDIRDLENDMFSICGLRILSDELRDNPGLVLKAIRTNPSALSLASDRLKSEKKVVWAAVCKDAGTIIYASDKIISDPTFLLNTMKQSVIQKERFEKEQEESSFYFKSKYEGITPEKIFEMADSRLQESKKFALYSIRYSEDIIDKIDDNYKSDKDFLLKAIENNEKVIYKLDEKFYKDKSFCKKVMGINGLLISVFDNTLKYDSEIIELAVSNNGLALQYFLNTKLPHDIYMKAVSNNGLALEYCPIKERTEELVLAAVTNNGLALEYSPSSLKHNRELIEKAIENNGIALRYLLPEDKSDIELIKIAVSSNPESFRYAKTENEDSMDFMVNLIKEKPILLKDISSDLKRNRNFIIRVLKANIDAYEYIPVEYKVDESIKHIYNIKKRIKK